MKNLITCFIDQILQEDFESFASELETNPMGIRDYEKGFQIYNWETSRAADDRLPEFKPKAVWLKKLWNKHVDRQFIQSLDTVHWLHHTQNVSAATLDSKKKGLSHPAYSVWRDIKYFFETTPAGAEISTTGYLPDTLLASDWGKIGILVKGYVTFAGNHMDIVWSGDAPGVKYQDFKAQVRDKMARRPGVFTSMDFVKANKPYILDKESYDKKFTKQNELIIAHWTPVAIVIPSEIWIAFGPKWQSAFIDLAKDNGCRCVNRAKKDLTLRTKITDENKI